MKSGAKGGTIGSNALYRKDRRATWSAVGCCGSPRESVFQLEARRAADEETGRGYERETSTRADTGKFRGAGVGDCMNGVCGEKGGGGES